MTHPPDRTRPPGRNGTGPIEPGSPLHRLLVMIAEAIVRSRAAGSDETTERPDREPEPQQAPAPAPSPPE